MKDRYTATSSFDEGLRELNGWKNEIEEREDGFFSELSEAQKRKNTPVFTGVLAYFPDAIKEVARASFEGNKQHHNGKPLHWDRNKSTDELDSCTRHLIDHASGIEFDDCGTRHLTKCIWRLLAHVQKTIENKKGDR